MTSSLVTAADKIVIVGFMGVGKSTIGRLLANRLRWNFVDLDEVIEREFGCSIPDVFETWGEKAFRDKERTSALTMCGPQSNSRRVIALGGGTFTQESVRAHCMKHTWVVLLDLSWEQWRELRMPQIIDSRPVLKNLSLEATHDLFDQRSAQYTHHHRFLIDKLSPDEVVDRIVDALDLSVKSAAENVLPADNAR